MILLIAVPVFSVIVQSFFVEHEQVLIEVENCNPFKCVKSLSVDQQAGAKLSQEAPLGRFNGINTYTTRNHLAFDEVALAWMESKSLVDFGAKLLNLPFYKVHLLNLNYTFIVSPFVLIFGLAIALAVNGLPKFVKGPSIFV